MTKIPTLQLTFEEYLDYDDGTDNLYELVDGELVAMTPVNPWHSDISDFISNTFKAEVKRLGLDWRVKSEVGVRTQIRRSRVPDVAVIEGAAWRELRRKAIKSAVLQEPILLAVEVVSPAQEDRDYLDKKAEYEALEIPEYWIVDYNIERVFVLILVKNHYQIREFTGQERIISQTFPEIMITAEQIFAA